MSKYLLNTVFNIFYDGKDTQRQKSLTSTKVVMLPCSAELQP